MHYLFTYFRLMSPQHHHETKAGSKFAESLTLNIVLYIEVNTEQVC